MAETFASLEGKRALVTGASKGIGRAIAQELARAGATVVVGYRSGKDEADVFAAELGGRAIQADVSNAEDAQRLVEEAGDLDILVNNAGLTRDGLLARMSDDDWRTVIDTNLSSVFYTCRAVCRPMMKKRAGSIVNVSSPEDAKRLVDEAGDIDVLVNNAGLTRDGLLARMSDDDWRTVIDTNLSSVFYTCRAVTRPMMKKRGGSIVNISSVVGVHGNWGQTNYAASKAGIIGFTKSLARELGSRNIRANVVAPGYVKTALTDVLPEEATAAMIQNTPLARVAEPEEIAGAVRFLASDDASFITGEVLLVDGGLGM